MEVDRYAIQERKAKAFYVVETSWDSWGVGSRNKEAKEMIRAPVKWTKSYREEYSKEKKEHPWATSKQISRIVADHYRKKWFMMAKKPSEAQLKARAKFVAMIKAKKKK